jgi:hypothetical protein
LILAVALFPAQQLLARHMGGRQGLAATFSSLGYGDVLMSARWKLLGPLEAANGVLMFGMTSAALMAIVQKLIRLQFDTSQARAQ